MFAIDIFSSSIILSAILCLFAGVLSFLSPCVLPILPPYLAYMAGTTVSEIKNNNETVKTIVSFESNEKSEDSARVTIKEIFDQLELSSKEKIYFDLLNRYSDGQKLSDDERKFIKNFKK